MHEAPARIGPYRAGMMKNQLPAEKITLVGAGLAGSLLAIFLAQRGLQVEMYEKRPDIRQGVASAGRSINLALSRRGIHALQQVGLYEAIQPLTIPMHGRMIHASDGELRFQPYGKDASEVLHAISRADLNKTLLCAAEQYAGVHITFNAQCEGVRLNTGDLLLRHSTTGAKRCISVDRVIGTDGSASALRTSMLPIGRFNFSQQYLDHGYKELTIPPGPDGTFQLEKNALHIWPRGGCMLIALPNVDGSFTCTLFLPYAGDSSFASLSSPAKVLEFFHQQFADAVPLMPQLGDDFFRHPTGSLVTIKCFPWQIEDKVLLLGDAAHAIVPFYGQGMNCAFEDCTYLDACIEKSFPDWADIFRAYAASRKEHTDAIADMALGHFVEMRDYVADPKFLLQKSVELALQRQYPHVFIPAYAMVTFHRTPYALARHKGTIQAEILRELCASIESVEQLDWDKADRLIASALLASP